MPGFEQLLVFGKQYLSTVEQKDGVFFAHLSTHDLHVQGFSRVHALSNLHFAIVCLMHIEAKRCSS